MSLPSLYPFVHYADPESALRFLKQAFGCEERVVYRKPDGVIAHAELTLGHGLVMFGGAEGSRLKMVASKDVPLKNQGIYVVVTDPDALYARAKAAGAVIAMELHDTDYGSRDFSALDPEGNVWSFGTYQPFASKP
ncbi:VOC family protein [Corallococcus interemptor]|uniref:VOC family protein n=1 Tax=Corallococcus interemptor TaxID=2316720 RepID=UPI003D01065D